jgi:hypothetical protein
MGVTDWFRRLFSPSADDTVVAEGEAFKSGTPERERLDRMRADGASGFAGLEVADAAEDAVEGVDLPSDPAP